jgi:ABC-type bacteriocin/lantibiotic exporter with double-glycine peptidase domain
VIAALIMCQKIGDLLVPWFAGRVIDAMAQGQPLVSVTAPILIAFGFWVLHGNFLPYVLGRFDVRHFHYPARQHVSVGNIRTVLANPAAESRGKDTAMQQAVIERGEQVLVDFTNSLFRVAIPTTIPGVVTLGLLLWWFPMLGLISIMGGALDLLVTLYLNKAMAPMFTKLQQFDFLRHRLLTQIFRDVPAIFAARQERDKTGEYDARYGDYASFGITTGIRFLGFNLGRGLIVNLTNLCTWFVGAWYVSTGVYSLGLFLASLSWSTYVMNVLGAALDLHKQWLETMPAIRAYFAEIDSLATRPIAETASRPDEAPATIDPAAPATPWFEEVSPAVSPAASALVRVA